MARANESLKRLAARHPLVHSTAIESAECTDARPVVAQAVAVSKTEGPERGLERLDAITPMAPDDYQPYWSARAHLLLRIGRLDEARDAYDRAIGLAEEDGVRRWLLAKKRALDETTSSAREIGDGV